jgi:hypothetical protein
MNKKRYYNKKQDYMDRLKLALLIMVVLSPFLIFQECKGQDFSIGGGASYSIIKGGNETDFIDPIGFYIEGGITEPITDHLKVAGSAVFLNQRSKSDGNKYQVNSANATFAFKIYPLAKGVNIYTGFMIGRTLTAKTNKEDILGFEKSNASGVLGLGYEVDRLEFLVRFNKQLTNDVFDRMIQFGLLYKLTK